MLRKHCFLPIFEMLNNVLSVIILSDRLCQTLSSWPWWEHSPADCGAIAVVPWRTMIQQRPRWNKKLKLIYVSGEEGATQRGDLQESDGRIGPPRRRSQRRLGLRFEVWFLVDQIAGNWRFLRSGPETSFKTKIYELTIIKPLRERNCFP